MTRHKGTRRRFSSEEKARAVMRHVMGKEPVSDICEDLGMAPNQFYRWQKEFQDNAAAAFEVRGRAKSEATRTKKLERDVDNLQAKLAQKDSVIAEITEDYVKLKKTFGED